MSTRRARIKGIAVLPPRRKNLENKNKPSTPKAIEKEIKSPTTSSNENRDISTPKQTSSPSVDSLKVTLNAESIIQSTPKATEKEIKSPTASSNENRDISSSPANSPKVTLNAEPIQNKSEVQKLASPLIKSSQVTDTQRNTNSTPNPVSAEKVSVITATPNLKTSYNSTFASPLFRTNVERRPFLSPSPKLISRNTNRGTPQKSIERDKQIARSRTTEEAAPKSVESIEDYNVPSVLESVTDEAMDGIVPLQPVQNAPKPIDILKNEIISENAEVLFDPIIPLPSPSKVRPKVKPIPRLLPHRRNSIQGSASESEDESRRLLNSGTPAPARSRHDSQTSHTTAPSTVNREITRVRNDSVCSTVSQLNTAPPASPLREKITKNRRTDASRRMAAMRRARENTRPENMTMYDLIFYNPTTKPMVPDQDEVKAKEAEKEAESSKPDEDSADDPDDPPETDAAPVPQIKLGPNGEIMLDEQSLVIKQTETRKVSSSVVREGAWSSGGGRYTRAARTAEWSPEETVRFYRALASVGTDFTLMTALFPKRSRKDLKLKFKKEERKNGALIDKALRSGTSWDVDGLMAEFTEEREEAEKKKELEKQRMKEFKEQERQRLKNAKKMGVRKSRASRALEASVTPDFSYADSATADDIILKGQLKRRCPVPVAPRPRKRPIPMLQPLNKFGTPPVPPTTFSPNDRTAPRPSTSQAPFIPAPIRLPNIPKNIEDGSLVVLSVTDPSSPSKKMLQTYIAQGPNNLTPVELPPQLLSSVVSYIKRTPSVSSASSPLQSPVSIDSRTGTPNIIQMNPSPNKRIRHNSYTVTQL